MPLGIPFTHPIPLPVNSWPWLMLQPRMPRSIVPPNSRKKPPVHLPGYPAPTKQNFFEQWPTTSMVSSRILFPSCPRRRDCPNHEFVVKPGVLQVSFGFLPTWWRRVLGWTPASTMRCPTDNRFPNPTCVPCCVRSVLWGFFAPAISPWPSRLREATPPLLLRAVVP